MSNVEVLQPWITRTPMFRGTHDLLPAARMDWEDQSPADLFTPLIRNKPHDYQATTRERHCMLCMYTDHSFSNEYQSQESSRLPLAKDLFIFIRRSMFNQCRMSKFCNPGSLGTPMFRGTHDPFTHSLE
jgi:hypothetical protein